MTISDRKLRSIHKRKVEPVLGSIDGWNDVDPGSESSSWVAATPQTQSLVRRSPDRLDDDLAASWKGTRREQLTPLAKVVGDLVDKVDRRDVSRRRQVSSTVYEMH